MSKKYSINWLETTKQSNYEAAEAYLRLLFNPDYTARLIYYLKVAPIIEAQAKDIFRASELPLLDVTNEYVEKDIQKVKVGVELSPILLVRDEVNRKLIIADGYHRLCAIYHFEENVLIKAKLV